jgi:hypothetical protein
MSHIFPLVKRQWPTYAMIQRLELHPVRLTPA